MTLGRFDRAANEVIIGGFRREHAKGELKTRRDYEILRFLSPCWEKKCLEEVFYAGNAIFETFVQEFLSMPINLPVFGIPDVPVQYGRTMYVKQRCGDAPN